MSGHSKWHNIRVKKMASDARKGKAYTKYARLIEIAAREGGGDPMKNAKLRSLIDAAKAESVPNMNIERAVKKGTGELKGEAMQEVIYEAYGPGGAAIVIECLTDNKNRSLSNVKTILSKNGGRFAESGSVLWMFERKGVVAANGQLTNDNGKLTEAFELELIEKGADDIALHGDTVRVVCGMTHMGAVRDACKASGLHIESSGLQFIPKQTVPLASEHLAKLDVLLSALDEDDDVSEVHANAVIAA